MPAFLEKKLRDEYAAKGKSGEALDHAVYGTMNRLGAMKGSAETAKGRAMEKKHEADSLKGLKRAAAKKY